MNTGQPTELMRAIKIRE